jgi:hypothetical protein
MTLRPLLISGSSAQRGDIDKMLADGRLMTMKPVTAVRLFPDAAQEAALRDTLALCNRAANRVSAVAYSQRIRVHVMRLR